MKKWNQVWMMVLLVSLLAGCGAGVKTESTMAYDMASVPEAPAEAAIEEAAEAEMVFEESNRAGGASVTSTTGVESVASTSQKLIKTVGMNLETKEFDQLLEHIKTRVEEMGGYIENSEISGKQLLQPAWESLCVADLTHTGRTPGWICDHCRGTGKCNQQTGIRGGHYPEVRRCGKP